MRLLIATIAFFCLLGIGGAGSALFYFGKDLPSLDKLKHYTPARVSKVYANDLTLIGKFFNEERYVVPLQRIPKHVVNAFLAAEDSSFFQHPGIDIFSIFRAMLANLQKGGVRQGGSTITQQVAKTFLLTPERTMARKIKEVLLSYQIERNLSKEDILYLYLNQIYLGYGAYGVEAASLKYFGKHVADISIGEAAILAGLPRAPSKYSPFSSPKLARQRQEYVLTRMVEENMISKNEQKAALAKPISVQPNQDVNLSVAPYFVEMVRKYMVDHYGNNNLLTKGYSIYTSVDTRMSLAAAESLRKGLRALDKRQGFRGPLSALNGQKKIDSFISGLKKANNLTRDGFRKAVVLDVDDAFKVAKISLGQKQGFIQLKDTTWARPANNRKFSHWYRVSKLSEALRRGYVIYVSASTDPACQSCYLLEQIPKAQAALLSVSPRSGYVRAMVGGYDFEASEFNRALQAKRQPGSSFKPFVYTAALDKGYTAATPIIDSPVFFEDFVNSSPWKPENDSSEYRGDTTVRQALTHSLNVPTIKVASDITVPYIMSYVPRFGISSPLSRDLSIALGTSILGIDELTRGYTVFDNLGKAVPLVFITKILDENGRVIEDHAAQDPGQSAAEQVEQAEAFFVNQYAKRRTAFTLRNPLVRSILGESIERGNGLGAMVVPEIEASDDVNSQVSYGILDAPQVISPETAYIMTNILRGVTAYGTGYEASRLKRPVAGKTGTTNESLDAWFAGFTPHLTTIVWTGFDERQSLGALETGARAALPIWLPYMEKALEGTPATEFPMPREHLVSARIDMRTGLLATPNTKKPMMEIFVRGTEPTEYTRDEDQPTGDMLFDDKSL